MSRRALVLAAALSVLASCAQLPAPGKALRLQQEVMEVIEAFQLKGRISVRRGEENFSASIDWCHGRGADRILVSSPLGQGLARLTAGPGGAFLEMAQQERFEAAGLDELSERVFGTRLPFADMAFWVLGRPAAAGTTFSDGNGQLSTLSESGWTIEYLRYESKAPPALPVLLRARGDGVDVRLVVDAWNLAP